MLIGTEVRIIEHSIGIEDAHNGDTVEVESLGDHLRTDKEVGATCGEVVDNALVGLT